MQSLQLFAACRRKPIQDLELAGHEFELQDAVAEVGGPAARSVASYQKHISGSIGRRTLP